MKIVIVFFRNNFSRLTHFDNISKQNGINTPQRIEYLYMIGYFAKINPLNFFNGAFLQVY